MFFSLLIFRSYVYFLYYMYLCIVFYTLIVLSTYCVSKYILDKKSLKKNENVWSWYLLYLLWSNCVWSWCLLCLLWSIKKNVFDHGAYCTCYDPKKKFIVLNFTRKYILYKMIHLSTHLYGILPMYSIELCSSMLHKFAVLSFFFV